MVLLFACSGFSEIALTLFLLSNSITPKLSGFLTETPKIDENPSFKFSLALITLEIKFCP